MESEKIEFTVLDYKYTLLYLIIIIKPNCHVLF